MWQTSKTELSPGICLLYLKKTKKTTSAHICSLHTLLSNTTKISYGIFQLSLQTVERKYISKNPFSCRHGMQQKNENTILSLSQEEIPPFNLPFELYHKKTSTSNEGQTLKNILCFLAILLHAHSLFVRYNGCLMRPISLLTQHCF